jgi:hypothetical protein
MAMYSNTGALLATWGTTGTGAGEFTGATGLGTDGIGDVFVADTGNDRVERFGPAATPTKTSSWGQLKKLYR